ncbi:NEAT domain-containing protein [Crassaminicella profunda]|uniref:NEAT domain-containing protein n=1 Tax=Crassaminicella profunda TaxID=1286698 RepID=UPI001CA760A0|nr:NEAT domain-containing protein [Crassaminicella profunda]QZY55865.1 NEAT domain-containing protein [Crassaminicella profunda]
MKRLYQKILSGFLVFAMLLTLIPPIAVHAEELQLPDAVALESTLGQEINETNVTVADSVYSVETAITVENKIDSVALSDFQIKDTNAELYFYGTNAKEDAKKNSEPVKLEAGKDTTVYVKVIANDGSASSKYTIHIHRVEEKEKKEEDTNANGIADRVEIKTVAGKTPTIMRIQYIKEDNTYGVSASLSVESTTASIKTNDIVCMDESATVNIKGTDDKGKEIPIKEKSLKAGEMTIVPIQVEAGDGSIKSSYFLMVTREEGEKDTNSNDLPDRVEIKTVTGKTLTIMRTQYIKEDNTYGVSASLSVESTTASIKTNDIVCMDESATVNIKGTDDKGKEIPIKEKSLKAGEMTIVPIQVEAGDGSIKSSYFLMVTRAEGEAGEEDTNANGIADKVDIQSVLGKTPTIDKKTYDDQDKVYKIEASLTVNSEIQSILASDIIAVNEHAEAQLIDKDGELISKAIELKAGKDTIVYIKVCAEDSSKGIYTIRISKEKANTKEISKFEEIQLYGGTIDQPVYKAVYEVEDYLNENYSKVVISNTSDTVPVIQWKNEKGYTLNTAGDYIFTAQLGEIPKGYSLGEGVTATAVVSILDKNASAGVKDPVLQKKLCAILKVEENHEITIGDMMGLEGKIDLSKHDNDGAIKDCSGLGYGKNITKLDISRNELENIPNLARLTKLTDLNLRTNKFTSLTVKDLPELTELYVCDNVLTHIELKGLPKLSTLSLGSIWGGNKFTTMPDISDLTGLTKVSIWRNKLTDITGDFSKLTKLTTIDASYNQLTSISESLCSITSLNVLKLEHNKIGAIDKNIAKLTDLTALDLSNNNLTTLPDHLSGLTNLKYLELDNNRFETIPDSIGDLTGLIRLDLNSNSLKTMSAEIGNLKKLQELYLTRNQLSKFPSGISKLVALKKIDMDLNLLTDIDVDSEGNKVDLSQLTKVESINLSRNRINQLPMSLKTLLNVKKLWMHYNYITRIPKDYLKDMKKLETFIIAFNYIDWNNDAISKEEIEGFLGAGHSAPSYEMHGKYATLKKIDTSVGTIELEDKAVDAYTENLKAPVGTTSITICPIGVRDETEITIKKKDEDSEETEESKDEKTIHSGESFTVNNLQPGANKITFVAENAIDNSKVTYKITVSVPKEGQGTLDPNHLPDGTYGLDIDNIKEHENAASITNQFVTEAATLEVKDGKMMLTVVWNHTSTISMSLLQGLWYMDKKENYVDLITPDDDPNTDKRTYSDKVKYDAKKDKLTITFPVESITEDAYLKVYVPEGMGESRPVFRTIFNTDTMVDLATGGSVNTIDLESIAIDTSKTKKEYTVGEKLDISGLVVTGSYDDGSKKILTIIEKNIVGFDSSSAAKSQTLTVMVNGKSATYDISIKGGTTGGAEGEQDQFLTNGTHRIRAWAKHFYENGKSMADQFIKRATTLEVQDEKVTVKMLWESINNCSLGKLKSLKYKNSDGELVNTHRTYDATNDSLELELEVEKRAIKEGITFEVIVPESAGGMGKAKFKLLFDLDSLDNVSEMIKEIDEEIRNGFYEADIKILKENKDQASIAESYFLKKADVEVKDDKNHVRLFIKNEEDIKDLKIEVDGNHVKYETKIVKEYENGKKASMIQFEIPKLDATIKLKAKIVPEDNKEVTFRVVLDQDQMKKKTDDSIDVYLNLLEGKVIKEVDLSENGFYEMTMEIKETDKSLLAMIQKYLEDEINYEVIKGKNYVQVMLKNTDEIKDLKVYVNSMGAKYEKIMNNERNTVVRFEVPDADAKIRFSICMTEEKEGYTGFDIALKKDIVKEVQEKIYLYIQSPEIVDVKRGAIQNIQLDVAPLIEENRTLVPLRGICETLGANVKWQGATRSILLSDGEMKIELQVDEKSAKVNGKTIKMDVAPKIINERTFVPIRFISENLKHEVKWIKEEQKIVITKKPNVVEKTDTTKKENKEK